MAEASKSVVINNVVLQIMWIDGTVLLWMSGLGLGQNFSFTFFFWT